MINNLTPLFIVGHKRSGSTFLGKTLNLHPEVFISNETDALWLLYQYYNNKKIEKYKHDGELGLNMSMDRFGNLLNIAKASFEVFCEIQLAAMNEGFMTNSKYEKPNLKYIGDQKPFQNSDPKLVKFVIENFPPPKYIHLIRNPYDVISSCKNFGKNNDGGWMWKNKSKDRILRHWVKVEKWVAMIKLDRPLSIIDIRYEDLIEFPKLSMTKVFNFLELNINESIVESIAQSVLKKERVRKKDVLITEEARKIMDDFNYSV